MGIGPGNIAAQMPPREDDQVRKQRDLERSQREQASARSAQAMQVGAGGITVNGGGSITVTDGGSLNIVGSGSINVPSGGLNSSGSISAATTITAGGNITGGGLISTGGITAVGGIAAGATIGGASLVATSDVTAGGRVVSAGVLNSPGTKANTVTVGYSAVYIDSAGDMGGNTSSRRYKQDITPVLTDTPGFLGLTTYKFRYKAAVEQLGDAAPWEFGLIAEEVVAVAPWACFYEADGVTVRGINYDRLIVSAMNVLADHERRLTAAGF